MIHWVLIIITTLIIVLINSEREKLNTYNDILDGYWEAPKTFCVKSGLKTAQIYIREDNAYLLIEDDDKVILNKCVQFTKTACWTTNVVQNDMEYDVKFDEPVDPLPQVCRMRVSLKNGLMGLFVRDTLYMELFRNNKASSGVV